MKFLTYRATPGLERYPEHEQFAVWQEVHQHLMRADYSYARQHQAYVATMTKASASVSLAGLPLVLGVVALILGRFLHWPAVYGVCASVAGAGFLLLVVVRLWRMANGQQRLMNGQIAAVLRQRAGSAA